MNLNNDNNNNSFIAKEKILRDRFQTENMSMLERVDFYNKKYENLKNLKGNHKNELVDLKALKNSSQNVLQFKLDEMIKKMKNEIYRLQEESRRHEESQRNENQKIQNHINYIRENCEALQKALKGISKLISEILERVTRLESQLGTF